MGDSHHISDDTSEETKGNPFANLPPSLISIMALPCFSYIVIWVCTVLEVKSQDSKLEFSEDEELLIARMFKLLGERWSLIAGRIPGRTAEEIEKYWTSRSSSSSER
ncbi:hypothetical protein L1049_010596 [Liquidambar formosana]|uniref:Uncharacterized protein n=1 Tax=Liquidambar formosana TaxID=63359 RepID=A0AAP0R4K4_LIQFO